MRDIQKYIKNIINRNKILLIWLISKETKNYVQLDRKKLNPIRREAII